MPFNLLKRYNELLELLHLNETQRNESLYRIFKRDIEDNNHFYFRQKQINPIKTEEDAMTVLFRHLTTVMEDKSTRKRIFEVDRSVRLYWLKHHIEERSQNNIWIFSAHDEKGIRTYIYDHLENYIIVLEPYRNRTEYYLLTAYHVTGETKRKFKINISEDY